MNNGELVKIIMEIYEKMYEEATPPADIHELIKCKETMKPEWFRKYSLPIKRQQTIIDDICKKHKLTKRETRRVNINVHLGGAPMDKQGDG